MHWIGAISILCMMLSAWAIYNASPSPHFLSRWSRSLPDVLLGRYHFHSGTLSERRIRLSES
jgi:hypothetical protein